MDQKKKTFAINSLRRASYRWPGRWQAEKRSKLEGRNQYLCESCKGVFKKKETQMDHTIPVIDPIKGWEGFDSFIDRLFCDENNFQRLCIPCHDKKTLAEGGIRTESKRKKRK